MAKRQSKISEVILRYDVDTGSVSDADKAANQVLSGLKDLEKQAEAARIEAARLANEIGNVSTVDRALEAVLKSQERAMQRNIQAMLEGRQIAEDYGDAYRRASDDVESFGDVATNISQISGLTRSIGLDVVADAGLIGADVVDAVEGLNRLRPAIGDVSEKVLQAVNNFTGMDYSLGQLGLVAGTAGAAFTLMAVAIQQGAERFREVEEEAQQAEAARRAGRRTGLEETQVFTEEDRQARFAELNQVLALENQLRREAYNEALQLANDALDDTTLTFRLFNSDIGDSVDNLDEARRVFENVGNVAVRIGESAEAAAVAGDAAATASGRFAALTSELENYDDSAREIEQEIRALESAQADASITANDLAAREAQLSETRQSAGQSLEDLIVQEQQAVRDQIAAIQSRIEAQRQQAEFERSITELAKDTSQRDALKSASEARITGLQDAFDEFLDGAADKVAAIESDLTKKENQIKQAYYTESLDSLNNYLEQERRTVDDSNRQRVRMLEDLQSQLLSAEESNDVVAFIRAQRAGTTQLSRFDEDASVAARRRSQDFQTEQKQRQDQLKTRLETEQNGARERIAAIQTSIDERRALLNQQINEERQAQVLRLELQRQALNAEIALRKQAYAQQLTDQAAYNAQQMMLQQKLNSGLAAAASSARQQYNIAATPTTSGSILSRLSTATSGLSSRATTINISTGNIGSNLSRAEVTSSLSTLAQRLLNAQSKALAAAKG